MPASIFNGTAVKLLKNILRFKSGHEIITGDTDNPTSVAKAGSPGYMYFRSGTNEVYTKADSGTTTNWTLLSTSAAGITQLTSDVTAGPGSGSQAATIAANAVTNTKLADMATQTIKGRTTAGTGDPEDLTATQATAVMNAMVGDSGSGGTKGLVPAPAAGDAAATKFLKADGTWAAIPGSASMAFVNASGTPTGTINGSYNTIVYGTENADTTASYDPSTGIFTAPSDGYYSVSASYVITGTSSADSQVTIQLYKNNTTSIVENQRRYASGATVGVTSLSAAAIQLVAGDTLRCRSLTDWTSPAYNGSAGYNTFEIAQLSSALVTQVVASYYDDASTTNVPTATTTIIDFPTKQKDTHNAVTTGSSWKFTCPSGCSGSYLVQVGYSANGNISIASTEYWQLILYKNNTFHRRVFEQPPASTSNEIGAFCTFRVDLVATDYIDFRINQTFGETMTTNNNSGSTWIEISRMP